MKTKIIHDSKGDVLIITVTIAGVDYVISESDELKCLVVDKDAPNLEPLDLVDHSKRRVLIK